MFVLAPLYVTAAQLADPTRPSYYKAADNSLVQSLKKGYQLSSVIVGENRRAAVINGQRVAEGDEIGEANVSKIASASVLLTVRGTTFSIGLVDEDIKR